MLHNSENDVVQINFYQRKIDSELLLLPMNFGILYIYMHIHE